MSPEQERFSKVMQVQGMKVKDFAEALGIQSGTISNIVGERNNPSLDVMQRILRRFTTINPTWLILGQGDMYLPTPQPTKVPPYTPPTPQVPPVQQVPPMGNLFAGNTPQEIVPHTVPIDRTDMEVSMDSPIDKNIVSDIKDEKVSSDGTVPSSTKKVITQMVVFYSDGTYNILSVKSF